MLISFEPDRTEDHRQRRGADRRSGGDRRTVDLLRETGRPEHDRRRADRRSGQDRRRDVPTRDVSPEVLLPSEFVTPWQMA